MWFFKKKYNQNDVEWVPNNTDAIKEKITDVISAIRPFVTECRQKQIDDGNQPCFCSNIVPRAYWCNECSVEIFCTSSRKAHNGSSD